MSEHPVVKIAFLDVGQGDTIVISVPDTHEAVIVDCIDANAVMRYLEHENIKHLRGLLVTHLHVDHYGGVVQLLNNIERELSLVCESVLFHIPKVSKALRDQILTDEDGHADGGLDRKAISRKRESNLRSLQLWAQSNKPRYKNLTLEPGRSLPLEGIIELIHPWEADVTDLLSHNLNNVSGVVKVYGANSSALLTGDIEPFGWENMDVDESKLQSDVLKFPHHGSWKEADVDQLLKVVNPSVVTISVGTTGIRYNHPNGHVFDAIARLPNVRLLCTQATQQCGKRVEENRDRLLNSFKKQSEKDATFFFHEQAGCPCSGTIIIELGDSARVIQPKIELHQNEIIKLNFDSHQCNVKRS